MLRTIFSRNVEMNNKDILHYELEEHMPNAHSVIETEDPRIAGIDTEEEVDKMRVSEEKLVQF